MINKIAIQKFRCFENFVMEDLAPITIIGGKNNSGKTALLESLVIPMTTNFPAMFLDLISSRIADTNSMTSRKMWNSLFYNMDDSSEFSIKINSSVDEEFIFTATKIFDRIIKPAENKQKISTAAKKFSTVKVVTEFNQDVMTGNYILPNKNFFNASEVNFESDVKTNFAQLPYGALTMYRNVTTGGNLAELVSQIGLDKDKKKLLIETMKNFDSDISDLNTILDNGSSDVYVTLNTNKYFPISYMGDGINKAVEILIDILNLQDGILLIDEAENGFHYSLYNKLLKVFFQAALSVNCQIIMTSHSREFIQSVMEVMQEIDLNNLSYQRLGMSKGKRQAYKFTGDLLCNAFETNMEVR